MTNEITGDDETLLYRLKIILKAISGGNGINRGVDPFVHTGKGLQEKFPDRRVIEML